MEKTLTIIKNESIKRGLVGEIIKKIESTGLVIDRIVLQKPTLKQAQEHYKYNIKWIKGLGEKSKKALNSNTKCLEIFETLDETKIGLKIYNWSVKQLAGKEIIVVVWKGNNAVIKVKKVVGDNEPSRSDLSTIRGMFSSDSYKKSNLQKRALYNVVHRSTNQTEAKREIKVWFK